MIVRDLHAVARFVRVHLFAERHLDEGHVRKERFMGRRPSHPGAEGEKADFQAGSAEISVLHQVFRIGFGC